MNKNRLILTLASSCLLVSCGVGEKEVKFDQAKETASEILKVTGPKDFKAPAKISGVLTSKVRGDEAKLTFSSDSETYCYYEKEEIKEKDDSTGEYTNYCFEKWSYKEGEHFITAGILSEGEESRKYYRNDLSWQPTYTSDFFIKMENEFLKEITEAKDEKEFFEEATDYESVKFRTSGKGSLVIEAKSKEDDTLSIRIEDNLLTDITMTSGEDAESFKITYGKAEFRKPDLTGFEFVTLE